MQDKSNYYPKYLDEAERYLFWKINEAAILFAPIILGLIADQFLLGLIVGPVGLVGLKRLNGRRGEKALYHEFYWHLQTPWGNGLEQTPSSHIREYCG